MTWILLRLCESNFCDDFNITDEYLVYIYNSFIFNLLLTFLFLTSSLRFVWEDREAAHVGRKFLDMLKSQMWQNS